MKKILLILCFVHVLFSKSVTIEVKGMHCPLCTIAVKKAVKKLKGINKISVKLNTKLVKVDFNEDKTSIKKILEAIKTTSYIGVALD